MRALGSDPERHSGARGVLTAFTEATAGGVTPDVQMYKHALRAADILGEWRKAMQVTGRRRHHHHHHHSTTTTTTTPTASLPPMQMLHQMREAGHAPELLTYGNVMSACARNGRVSTVLSLLDDVRADGLTPNAFCYNAAVLSCAKARRWRQALSLMREMEQVGAWATPHLAPLTTPPTTHHSPHAARILPPQVGGVEPTVHTYKAVMRACASAEQSRHVMQLLRQMERNNLTPTAVHYGIAVDACGRSGELKRMMNLLSEAQVTGCPTTPPPPRTNLHHATTTTATSTSPAPPSPLQARKLDLDAPTYTSAVHACATNGQLNRALGLVERMFKLDVKPDAATYNVLLQARAIMAQLWRNCTRASAQFPDAHPPSAAGVRPRGGSRRR